MSHNALNRSNASNTAAPDSRPKTLYISDLDGTLLNEQSAVSPVSKALLSRLISVNGALFTVATARTQATVTKLMEGIPAILPYIVMNGAGMWHAADEHYTTRSPIPEQTVHQIVAIYERRGIHPFVYRDHRGVIRAHHYTELTPTEKAFMAERTGTPYKQFVINDDPYRTDGDNALIIFSTNSFDRLEEVYHDILDAQIPCHAVCYHDIFNIRDGILEVYAPGVTKAAAVAALKKRTHAGRLVVFGDNLNDREMMALADHSVAVENAVPELKELASEVIGSNTADSVVKWIEQDIIQHAE